MIIFHALDWQWFHKIQDDISVYTIQIYGRKQNGESICVNVNKFTPYFYVKVPNEWTNSNTHFFIKRNE